MINFLTVVLPTLALLTWLGVATYLAIAHVRLLARERDAYRAAYLAKLGVLPADLPQVASLPSLVSLHSRTPLQAEVQPVRDEPATASGGELVAAARRGWTFHDQQAFAQWVPTQFIGGADDATAEQKWYDLYGTESPLSVFRV